MTAADPLVDVPLRDWLGGQVVTTRHTFRRLADKTALLAFVARADAHRVEPLARQLGTVEAAHAWVRDSIAYLDEPIERLERPAYVLHTRAADCDGQAVLLAALVVALGGAAELVPLGGTSEAPRHLAVRVRPSAAGVAAPVLVAPWEPLGRPAPAPWAWAETTIAAAYAEDPAAAVRRLGVTRGDVR